MIEIIRKGPSPEMGMALFFRAPGRAHSLEG